MPRHSFYAACARLLRLLACIFGLASGVAQAAGECSPAVRGVVLNEYAHQLNYAEMKRLNTGIDITGWKIRIYPSSSTYYQRTPSSSNPDCTTPIYLTALFGSSETPKDADIVLLDNNDDLVDIVRVRTFAPPYTAFYSPLPACNFISPPYDLEIDASRKGVDRTPDGLGPWRNTPGTGAGSYTTPCTGNTPNPTTVNLKTTKTVLPASENVGKTVTFTVVVLNNSTTNTPASTIVVSESLPAGLVYVSHSISKPAAASSTYSSATGLWSISALARGESATLTLVARVTSVGVFTNTATAYSDNIEATPADNTASVQVTGAVPMVTVSASPATVAVGGTTVFRIDVTNTQSAATGAFSVANTLDPGLVFQSVVGGGPSVGAFDSGTGIWSIPGLAAGATATLRIVVRVDASGTFADSARVVFATYTGPLASATVSTAATKLNAWINADRTISTQLVGDAVSLKVGAFDESDNPTVYTGNVTVELEYCTGVNRTSGGGISCMGAWALVTGVSRSVTFTNQAEVTTTLQAIDNAYEIVRVKLTPPSGPVDYSSDMFAVRPPSLTVAATDLDWLSAAGTRSLTTGVQTVLHKAGRPFTVLLWSTASRYPGTLLSVAGLGPVPVLSVPAGSETGNLDTGAWSVLADAVATRYGVQSTSAIYSEAGNVTVRFEDRHFADIDTGDSTPAQRYVVGTATVGRFVPDYLATTVTEGCGNAYTYSGQPFGVKVEAFAYGSTIPLRNYDKDAGFSKSVTLSNAGSATGMANGTIAASAFVKGTAAIVAGVGAPKYTLASVTTTPVTLALRAEDEDMVGSQRVLPDVAKEGTTQIRSGRLWFANAYGSELLPLAVPMQTQYWSASGWVLNVADNCTTLVRPDHNTNFGLINTLRDRTTASLSDPVSAGQANFRLSAPGAGNTGVVDIVGSVVRGGSTWLQLPVDKARACFGACGPRSPVIYRRERY